MLNFLSVNIPQKLVKIPYSTLGTSVHIHGSQRAREIWSWGKDGVGPVGKTLHPLLCRRLLVRCFCFFKLFCCLLQNYTKTIHVDEDGNVDDVDIDSGVGGGCDVDFLKRKAKAMGNKEDNGACVCMRVCECVSLCV